MKYNLKLLFLIVLINCVNDIVNAQNGYIYVQLKTLDEISSVDFTYSVTGGSTVVPNFQLNDKPLQTPLMDLGASQNGRLYAVGKNGILYYRDISSSSWIATTISDVVKVDGGSGINAYYITQAGSVYLYNGTTSTLIGSSSNYGSSNAYDIGSTWDNRPYIITNAGRLYRYGGSGTTWAQVTTSTNNVKVDGDPSTGNVIVI